METIDKLDRIGWIVYIGSLASVLLLVIDAPGALHHIIVRGIERSDYLGFKPFFSLRHFSSLCFIIFSYPLSVGK